MPLSYTCSLCKLVTALLLHARSKAVACTKHGLESHMTIGSEL